MAGVDDILAAIQAMRAGGTGETPKLDFKGSWYDTTTKAWAEELAKDVAAMANTPGPDGRIVFGVAKDGQVIGAPLRTLGVDESEIQRQIAKRISPPPRVTVDEYVLEDDRLVTCIVVHRSANRPHVVGSWRQRDNFIPVRRGTDTQPAGRYELDEMYSSKQRIGEIRTGLTSPIVRSGYRPPGFEHDALGAVNLWLSNSTENGLIVTEVRAVITFSTEEQLKIRIMGYNHDINDQRGLGKFPLSVGRTWAGNVWLNFGMLRGDLWYCTTARLSLEIITAMHSTIKCEYDVELQLQR